MSLTGGLFYDEKLKLQKTNEEIIKQNLLLSNENNDLLKKVENLLKQNDNLNQQIQDLLNENYTLKKTTFRINIFFMKLIIPIISYFLAIVGFIIIINLNSVRIQCIII
ncbi:hypothetical protein C2G38_2159524 [Gigaspora rosea]|uniref:Uncharacterized protein n=1 Tax=Gigaspora rosea TaxID=44941 RepID=A0A397UJE7_9GLOM|nr:hypothetical protein C2G38_2206612 [Gigaspora rosea]RIB27876.1 hypothetical protein C2G38_2159524 [Gigaspora rosea]